ncbi:MAG: acetyl/propionyl/methylcrotonyl-CoA carboxylase subunit alpha [Ktedonobacterales bacterium]
MFESVLIANRGEIAVRIIATCQEMGIRAIAVYSDADANALHVRCSDAAYPIGPAPALESYLNTPAILRVARESGAVAIHPGYGFLAENAEFARACAEAGIVFIGPTAEAIRLMGSKTTAKQMVEDAGVPTVPGYAGRQRDLVRMQREAARLGYPVMIKAAAGGGGKGMRVVHRRAEFGEALAAAQREAQSAFGDDSVFLEKLVVAPRHVEFQILADQYGHTIHLGERDCSIQRRHQKIVEESPCIALTPELRETMGQAAVKAAQAVGYVNAGTCEFLLDSDNQYYFLEMNTRLQVEHPVTEMVTGLDLVRLQLAIAAGQPLALSQEEVSRRGHAIEVRLYAEDPANNYLPSTGRLQYFQPPHAPGIRVDTGVAGGDEISVHYDPMLAKLIVYGPDRAAAIERLRWALDHCAVLGVATNMPLLRAIAGEADFVAGLTSTAYLETHASLGETPQVVAEPVVLVAAALWEALSMETAPLLVSDHHNPNHPYNPWTSNVAVSSQASRRFRYRSGTREFLVTLTEVPPGAGYTVTIDREPFPAHERSAVVSGRLTTANVIALLMGSVRRQAVVVQAGFDLEISYCGENYLLTKPRPLDVETSARQSEQPGGRQVLTAPMAGTVIKVQIHEGDLVTANQPLVILGAMKMEHAITAPHSGHIVRVAHEAGDVVRGGEILVELDTSMEKTRV